jgi:hypothetical protein
LKPNGTSEINDKSALARVEHRDECTNGHESRQFTPRSGPLVHATSTAELGAAILAVTRALATTHEYGQVLELVRERAALRRELQLLKRDERERPDDRVA